MPSFSRSQSTGAVGQEETIRSPAKFANKQPFVSYEGKTSRSRQVGCEFDQRRLLRFYAHLAPLGPALRQLTVVTF
jgi:hypothetical protein